MTKNKKKITLITLSALIACGAITASLSPTISTVKTQYTSQVKSADSSDQHIQSLLKDSKDAYASKLYVYAKNILKLSNEQANAYVSERYVNYSTQINKSLDVQDLDKAMALSADLKPVNNTDVIIGRIKALNKSAGLSITDTWDLSNTVADKVAKTLSIDMTNAGYATKDIDAQVDKTQQAIQKLASVQSSYVLSSLQSAFTLSNLIKAEDYKSQKLAAALADFSSELDVNNLHLVDDASQFLTTIFEYSSQKQGYKQGDQIKPADLQYLFTYDYDTTYGMSTPRLDSSNYETTNPIDSSITPAEIVSPYIQTLPLGAHDFIDGASYKEGEIIPGYTLHAKIIKADAITDSNYYNTTLTFGLSDTIQDPNAEHIMWEDSGTTHDYKVKVSSLAAKMNIAKNIYYNGWTYDVSGYTKNDIGAYFDSTKDKNTYLNDLLSPYENEDGTYNFDHAFIDPNAVAGVPMPQNDALVDKMHTNQTLKFHPIGADTTHDVLYASWVIVDSTRLGDDEIVYTFPIVGDAAYSTAIPIQFCIPVDLKAKLIIGYSLALAMTDISATKATLSNFNEDWLNRAYQYEIYKEAFACTELAVSATLAALTIAYTVSAWFTLNPRQAIGAVIFAGLSVISAVVSTLNLILQSIEVNNINKLRAIYNTVIKDNAAKIKNIEDWIDANELNIQTMLDSTKGYSAKTQATENLINNLKPQDYSCLMDLIDVIININHTLANNKHDEELNSLKDSWKGLVKQLNLVDSTVGYGGFTVGENYTVSAASTLSGLAEFAEYGMAASIGSAVNSINIFKAFKAWTQQMLTDIRNTYNEYAATRLGNYQAAIEEAMVIRRNSLDELNGPMGGQWSAENIQDVYKDMIDLNKTATKYRRTVQELHRQQEELAQNNQAVPNGMQEAMRVQTEAAMDAEEAANNAWARLRSMQDVMHADITDRRTAIDALADRSRLEAQQANDAQKEVDDANKAVEVEKQTKLAATSSGYAELILIFGAVDVIISIIDLAISDWSDTFNVKG